MEAAGGGCTLLSRLEEKYLDDEEEEVLDPSINLFIFSESPCKKAAERGLELVVLNHMNIDSLGDEFRLASLVKHVSEVDLAWNRLSKWPVVSRMLASLPSLRTLNLSHNPLEATISGTELPLLPRLSTLILNGTQLPHTTLKTLLSKLPSLQELHLSDNSFDDEHWTKDESALSDKVKVLYLTHCGISDWKHAEHLFRRFPQRRAVFLCENPIETVKAGEVDESLKALNLSKSHIADWESVAELGRLPGLQELRLNQIPLFDAYDEEERLHLTVGRIQGLRVLNGSHIDERQREQSERFFIRYYQDKENKPAEYEFLVKKHGELERLAKVDLSPKSVAQVTVICEENGYRANVRLKLARTVAHFMRCLEKPTQIPAKHMRLFFVDSDVPGCGPTELRFPNQPLRSLHIDDGDQFFVQSKIVPTRRKTMPPREIR